MKNIYSIKSKKKRNKNYFRSRIKLSKKYRVRMHSKRIKTAEEIEEEYYKQLEIKYRKKFKDVSKKIHSTIEYQVGETIININKTCGLEDVNDREYFFSVAEQCLNANTSQLTINIKDCNWIWPSCVTFLCSLSQWVSMNNQYSKIKQKIASTDSANAKVNTYLSKCGFYEYVGRREPKIIDVISTEKIIKIKRELDKSQVEIREKEIMSLLKKYSSFDDDQLELFNDIILTETFLNVTEHGIVNKTEGWWLIAQVHENHNLLSISIADNGIGFENTLLNGPQGKEIKEKGLSESDLIILAFKENVSGAFDAIGQTKKTKENRGSRRGNGLGRIRKTCEQLEIDFSIVSGRGFCYISKSGEVIKRTNDLPIFGGSMYSYFIELNRRPEWKA